ncbi:MAG: hypothetical protein JWO75_6388 [Actinomycetia bacterium]|nr:hypothetical protein [Actinomycetes bacterium]
MSVAPPAETPVPASPQAPVAPAGRAFAWTAAPVLAALLVRETSRVSLAGASVPVTALAVSGLYIGSAVLAATPGVALVSVLARRRDLGPATVLGVLLAGSGAAAMAGFWAWFASPVFGRDLDVALGVASVAAIAVFGRRGDLRTAGLSVPMLLALAIGLAFTGLAFIQGDGIAQNVVAAVASRYWRTQDNALPLLFAARVAAHAPLSGYLLGSWLSSDRPPLQTGFALLQWPLWSSAGRPAAYQMLATGLSASWLPAMWVAFRVRGVAQWRILVVVLATTLTGFVFVSTIYVWPKMMAGTFALAAVAIVVSRDEADRRLASGVVAVALVTLGLLAHGGVVFAVLALLPFAYRLRRRITVRAVAACAAVAVAGYLPWTLYQHFVDPPGDRLLKWQLAGVLPIDPRGFLQTILQQYQRLSLHDVLANKGVSLVSLAADPFIWRTQLAEPAWASGFLGYARLAQLNDLLPATGLLLLGAVALLVRSSRRALAPAAPLAAFTGIALVLWVVILWGGQAVPAINHEGTYAVIVLFIALCALGVTYLPWPAATLILAGSAAWFAVSWIPGLGFVPAAVIKVPPGTAPGSPLVRGAELARQLNPAMLIVCLAGVALVAAAIAWMRFSPAHPGRDFAGGRLAAAGNPADVPLGCEHGD